MESSQNDRSSKSQCRTRESADLNEGNYRPTQTWLQGVLISNQWTLRRLHCANLAIEPLGNRAALSAVSRIFAGFVSLRSMNSGLLDSRSHGPSSDLGNNRNKSKTRSKRTGQKSKRVASHACRSIRTSATAAFRFNQGSYPLVSINTAPQNHQPLRDIAFLRFRGAS